MTRASASAGVIALGGTEVGPGDGTEVGLGDVPEVGLGDVPEVGPRDVPEAAPAHPAIAALMSVTTIADRNAERLNMAQGRPIVAVGSEWPGVTHGTPASEPFETGRRAPAGRWP